MQVMIQSNQFIVEYLVCPVYAILKRKYNTCLSVTVSLSVLLVCVDLCCVSCYSYDSYLVIGCTLMINKTFL
jgi:hypothetical protein